MKNNYFQSLLETLSEMGETKQNIIKISQYLISKYESTVGLSSLEKANFFWKSALNFENRIKHPQRNNCKFAVVVPVQNESIKRIHRQLESLQNQNGLHPEELEVIYVVNNDKPANSAESSHIFNCNSVVIEYLTKMSSLNVFVIDKSSPGNEIINCSIGKARNSGTAEASIRFFENNKNGIIIQTDADTYFEDRNYFKKLIESLNSYPNAIGIYGNLLWEFDPDNTAIGSHDLLFKKSQKVILYKKWQIFSDFLRGAGYMVTKSYKKQFSGAHIISKSFESAVIGGFYTEGAPEDTIFGWELEQYAKEQNMEILSEVDCNLTTAFRESKRTTGSMGRLLDNINTDGPVLMENPFANESFKQFFERIKLTIKNTEFSKKSLYSALNNIEKPVFDELFLNDLLEIFEGFKQTDDFENENFLFIVSVLFEKKYPKISLTEDNYNKLKKRVETKENGKDLINYLDKITRGF